MQLSINCHIHHCWYCCPVPWVVMQSSRAAKRDVIGYNNCAWWTAVDMSSIMLMRLQKLCKPCRASCYFILYYFGAKWQNSCTILVQDYHYILFYCKWANRSCNTSQYHKVSQYLNKVKHIMLLTHLVLTVHAATQQFTYNLAYQSTALNICCI